MKKTLSWLLILITILSATTLAGCRNSIRNIDFDDDEDNDSYYDDNDDNDNNDYNSSNQESDDIRVGSIIKFGSYEQDNNEDNGNEDIEWIIVDIKDNKLLLVSKYVLDATQYTYSEYGSTWEDSSANNYLIETIYKQAFSYLERKKLTTGKIESDEGSFTPTEQVFALSSEEFQNFANDVSSLYDCYPTEYAKAEGVAVSSSEASAGMSYWWVRDESVYGTVMAPSSVSWVSTQYKETQYGVRPAIWVEKDYKTSTNSNATVSSNMIGVWETISGAKKHDIEISSNGTIIFDDLTVNFVCYSPTEIAINDYSSDSAAYVFVLENNKIIRYAKYGLPDNYVYAKKR